MIPASVVAAAVLCVPALGALVLAWDKLLKRYPPVWLMKWPPIVAGVICLAAAADMLASGWQPIEMTEAEAGAVGRTAAHGHGKGGIIVLAILFWPYVLGTIGLAYLSLPVWDLIGAQWRRIPAALRGGLKGAAKGLRNSRAARRDTGLIAWARSQLSDRESETIVRRLGIVIGSVDLLSTGRVADVQLLGCTKDQARAALIIAISSSSDPRQRETLGVAYVMLALYQPGVGPEPQPESRWSSAVDAERVRLLADLRRLDG